MSATTIGLLLPLSFNNKPLGASLLRVGMKSGTPVACRRFLNNSSFLSTVMRQLESPHAMLRAKAYLLAAAALDSASSACSKTLITACDARLPSCLERDLKMTNQHYIPRSALDENSVFLSVESRSHSQMALSTSPGLQYLGICVKHLSDLIVYSLIPNICKQVRSYLDTFTFPTVNRKLLIVLSGGYCNWSLRYWCMQQCKAYIYVSQTSIHHDLKYLSGAN